MQQAANITGRDVIIKHMRSCPFSGEHHHEQYDPGEGHEKQDGGIVTIKTTTADRAITCSSTEVLGRGRKKSISTGVPKMQDAGYNGAQDKLQGGLRGKCR